MPIIFLSGLAQEKNFAFALLESVDDLDGSPSEGACRIGFARDLVAQFVRRHDLDGADQESITQALLRPQGLQIPGCRSAKLRRAEEVVAHEFATLADMESLLVYYKNNDVYRDMLSTMPQHISNGAGGSVPNEAYYVAQMRVMRAVAGCSDRGDLHGMLDFLAEDCPSEYTPAVVAAISAQIDEADWPK
jgi:hypothetical protein